MRRASILTVGDEILRGDIVDTNSSEIARIFFQEGYVVQEHMSVGDDQEAIAKSVKNLLESSDVLIISGGLGPTQDDCTREGVAEALHLPLRCNEKVREEIWKRLSIYSEAIPENNVRQAYLLEGAVVLPNLHGTAPGQYVELDGKQIFLLPGPPAEFHEMIPEVVGHLRQCGIFQRRWSLFVGGLGESVVEDRLRHDPRLQAISLNTFAHGPLVEIVLYLCDKMERGTLFLRQKEEVFFILREMFADASLLLEGEEPKQAVIERLKNRDMHLSFVESITGGLLARELTKIPGASEVFRGSLVTYSHETKELLAQVSHETLEKYTAISPEVALEMAQGLLAQGFCDLAVATTGEAGPITQEGALGEVYIAYCTHDSQRVESYRFKGTRKTIQESIASRVFLSLLTHELGGHHDKN